MKKKTHKPQRTKKGKSATDSQKLAEAYARLRGSDEFKTPEQALREAHKALRADEPFTAWQRAHRGMADAEGRTRQALLKLSIDALRRICVDLDEHGDAHLDMHGGNAISADDFRRFLEEAKTALRGKIDVPPLPPLPQGPGRVTLGVPVQLTPTSGPRPLWTVAGFIGGKEGDGDTGVVIRDSQGVRVGTFETEAFTSVAVSPDQRTLAIGQHESKSMIYDIAQGTKRAIGTGQRDWVTSLVFSPDNKLLYTGGEGRVIAYDAATGKTVAKRDLYKSGTNFLRDLAVTQDGSLLLTARDETIHVLDARTLAPVRRGTEEDCPGDFLAIDARRLIALPGGQIGIIDAASGTLIEKVWLPTEGTWDTARGVRLALNAKHDLAAVLFHTYRVKNDENRVRLQIWSLAPLTLLADAALPGFVHTASYALGGVSFYPQDEAILVVGKSETLCVPLNVERTHLKQR